MALHSPKSAPARLLFDALDVEATKAGAGAARYVKKIEAGQCKISVSGNEEQVEMTVFRDGTVCLVKTDYGKTFQSWTLVKANGHVVAAVKPFHPETHPFGPFQKQTLPDPARTAVELRDRRDQAFAAIRQLLPVHLNVSHRQQLHNI